MRNVSGVNKILGFEQSRRSQYVGGVLSYSGIRLISGIFVRNLPTLHVHLIIVFVDQIFDHDKFIPFLFQRGDHFIQSFGSMLGSVVAEDDGAVAQMLVVAHSVDDGVHTVVLPVERIHILNTWIQLVLEALRCMEGNKIYSN